MTIMNGRKFLQDVLQTLQDKQLAVWLFGGWAEELHGVSARREHQDIDLLYPAADFRAIDSLLDVNADWHEILSKRFPHKRAAMFQDIMVEFILIQKDAKGMFTRFFDRHRFNWPEDTLGSVVSLNFKTVKTASRTALQEYRLAHAAIQDAYHAYVAEQVALAKEALSGDFF